MFSWSHETQNVPHTKSIRKMANFLRQPSHDTHYDISVITYQKIEWEAEVSWAFKGHPYSKHALKKREQWGLSSQNSTHTRFHWCHFLFKSVHRRRESETLAIFMCTYFMDSLLHTLSHTRLRLVKSSFDLSLSKATRKVWIWRRIK